LASKDIHELEAVVAVEKDKCERLEACLSLTENKVVTFKEQLKTNTKSFEDYIRRVSDDENALKEEIQELETQVRNLESVAQEREFVIQGSEQQLKLITSELILVKQLLKEERDEAKATREMIYLRTGMKREVFASSEEVKEVKEERATTAPPRTRSQIKNQLEARASRLLKEQKQKEDDAINSGQLPPAESTTH
jgi:hypothetical protein